MIKQPTETRPRTSPFGLVAGTVLALGCAAVQAASYSPGYQYDMQGNIARAPDGSCLRTSKWAPDNALETCDPEAVAQYDSDIPKPKFARVVGVKPVTAVINLLADETFGFNSAKLSERGETAIAGAVEANKDNYIYRVSVVGYTDRIGKLAYNMKLSEERAAAVKAAFVAAGVPEERIYTQGRGPADPLVNCVGQEGYALIRCLAPNRRVVVMLTVPEVIAGSLEAEYVRTRAPGDAPNVEQADVVEKAGVVDASFIAPVVQAALKEVGGACSQEINTYCSRVPLGEFRVYDCLKAHEGELSVGCAGAMVEGRSAVEKALGDANFFGAQCGPDIKDRCPEVPLGSGQVLACLKTKINTVTKRCVDAMLQTGLLTRDPFNRPEYAQ